MKCSIIIPCYNESANLPALVARLDAFQTKEEMEFILVENGSADDSYRIMQELTKGKKAFKIVKVEVNQGYGYGLQQGLAAATGDYVGWWHADMQLGMNEMGDFVSYLTEHNYPKHIMLKASRRNRSMMDYVFTFGQAVFESFLFCTFMKDVQATPVLFDSSLREQMTKTPNGFEIDIYTYVLAKKCRYNVERIKVRQLERVGGASSWNTGLQSRIRQSMRIIKGSIALKKSMKQN